MQETEEDCHIVITFIEMGIIISSVFVYWRIKSAVEVTGFMTMSGVTWRGHGYDIVHSVHQQRSQV